MLPRWIRRILSASFRAMKSFSRKRRSASRRRPPLYNRTPSAPSAAAHDTLTGHPSASPTAVRALAYGPDSFHEQADATPEQIVDLRRRFPVVWVDAAGLADLPRIQALGNLFELHPLSIEDVVHTHQRPKVETFEAYHFIIIRMAPLAAEHDTDQLALFLGDGYVLTFQERAGDDLDGVRNRIRQARGRIRAAGSDYLTYAILDAAIDAYFPLLERNGSELEDLEDSIILTPDRSSLARIYAARRSLLTLRRAVWPLREAVGALTRDDTNRFAPETRVFLRDVYDHTIQLLDLMETYRELSSNLMDVYLSAMNNRMGEVMKVLTIITTIFIPLSFIAGVYGMNFDTQASPWNMPELEWRWGYVVCLLLMALIAGAEIVYFRRRGWIGTPKPPPDQDSDAESPRRRRA